MFSMVFAETAEESYGEPARTSSKSFMLNRDAIKLIDGEKQDTEEESKQAKKAEVE